MEESLFVFTVFGSDLGKCIVWTFKWVLRCRSSKLHVYVFLGWTFSVKKKTDKELSAQVPSKMAVMGGKKWKWMFCFFSPIIFQEKTCHLWKDVLVSMSKMYIRTWPTPAMGSLGTSLIYLCWFSRIQMPGLALEAIGQDNLRKVWQKSSAMQYNTWVHFWYRLTWHCFSLLPLASAAVFPLHNLCKNRFELYIKIVLLPKSA